MEWLKNIVHDIRMGIVMLTTPPMPQEQIAWIIQAYLSRHVYATADQLYGQFDHFDIHSKPHKAVTMAYVYSTLLRMRDEGLVRADPAGEAGIRIWSLTK